MDSYVISFYLKSSRNFLTKYWLITQWDATVSYKNNSHATWTDRIFFPLRVSYNMIGISLYLFSLIFSFGLNFNLLGIPFISLNNLLDLLISLLMVQYMEYWYQCGSYWYETFHIFWTSCNLVSQRVWTCVYFLFDTIIRIGVRIEFVIFLHYLFDSLGVPLIDILRSNFIRIIFTHMDPLELLLFWLLLFLKSCSNSVKISDAVAIFFYKYST